MFVDGLDPAIRPVVARFRESRSRKRLTYQSLVHFAQSEGDAYRARRRHGQKPPLFVSKTDKDASKDARRGSALIADSSVEFRDPEYRTVAPRADENAYLAHEDWSSVPTGVLPSQTNEDSGSGSALAMGYMPAPRIPYHNMSNRPGWVQKPYQGNKTQSPSSDLICHSCYARGHVASKCTLYLKDWPHVIRNYESLSEVDRTKVPNTSYLVARLRFQSSTAPAFQKPLQRPFPDKTNAGHLALKETLPNTAPTPNAVAPPKYIAQETSPSPKN